MQDDHAVVLLEDIQGKLQSWAEVVSTLATDVHEVKQTVAVIPQMAADIKTIKAVQVEQGKQLQYHKTYLVGQGMPVRA